MFWSPNQSIPTYKLKIFIHGYSLNFLFYLLFDGVFIVENPLVCLISKDEDFCLAAGKEEVFFLVEPGFCMPICLVLGSKNEFDPVEIFEKFRDST